MPQTKWMSVQKYFLLSRCCIGYLMRNDASPNLCTAITVRHISANIKFKSTYIYVARMWFRHTPKIYVVPKTVWFVISSIVLIEVVCNQSGSLHTIIIFANSLCISFMAIFHAKKTDYFLIEFGKCIAVQFTSIDLQCVWNLCFAFQFNTVIIPKKKNAVFLELS